MYKIIERIGFVLFTIGFLLMITERLVDGGLFYVVIEKWEIFFWGGMALWAIGYGQREKINYHK